ncbi:hypothetical protein [Paenibacillus sp. FSL L8-0708]|uniref:hypothetical protein n=1 Tax=Paenibacillus sp. FSL L8-0708 TaxID=2975311 RepID=UPI0030FB3B4B
MEKTINLAVTKQELATIISALDFTLIKGTDEQFTEDSSLLDEIYDALDAFDDADDALYVFTKTLASRLAAKFTEVAA